MGKGSSRRPTDKVAFDENFDRIFGRGRRADDDKVRWWCPTCESPLIKGQARTVISNETVSRRYNEDVVCELCGMGGAVEYNYQDLSPDERQYLN